MPQRTGTWVGVGAAAALLFALGYPAWAEPSTSLGLYEEVSSASCSTATTCVVYFSLLSGPLKIVSASCHITAASANGGGGAYPVTIQVAQSNSSETSLSLGQYLSNVQIIGAIVTSSTETGYFQVLADTLHVIASGTRPAIQISYSGQPTSTIQNCTISGTQS